MAIKSHVANQNWYDNYDKVFGKKPKIKSIDEVDKLAKVNKSAKSKKDSGSPSQTEPVVERAEVVIQEQDSTTFSSERAIEAPKRKRTRSRSHQETDDKKKY